jgi:hypothetical protein
MCISYKLPKMKVKVIHLKVVHATKVVLKNSLVKIVSTKSYIKFYTLVIIIVFQIWKICEV